MSLTYYRLIWLLPLAFAAHVTEEYLTDFPGYADAVSGWPMALPLFLGSNIAFIAIMALLVRWTAKTQTAKANGWLLFWAAGNQFWNFVFHAITAIAFGRSPGLITATVLYLPLFGAVSVAALKEGVVTSGALTKATLLGGLWMGAIAAFAIFHVGGF